MSRMESMGLGERTATELEKQEYVQREKFVISHWSMADLRAILKEKQKFISKT